MKVMISLLLSLVIFSQAQADRPDLIYFQIEPMVGDKPALSESGIVGGCYIGPGKTCDGLFYINDDGSGVLVGSIINDLVSEPEFELVYSITLTKEGGRDMLVGSAYAMELSPEGEILGGRRTEIRQYFTYGEEIVLAQPVGRLPGGENIFLQMSANTQKPKPVDKSGEHPITLISTQLVDNEQYSRATNSYHRPKSTYAFRAGFSSEEKNGACEMLRYDVEVRMDYREGYDSATASGRSGQPVRGRLSFNRTYAIDTLNYPHASFTPDVTYVSKYTKDVDIVPGKMLKLVFPPDTPSVRGFDIEDTLIIVPQ
jgi:hypothetical protein